MIEREEGEAFGAEEDRVLGEGTADKIVCCAAGERVGERLGREPS